MTGKQAENTYKFPCLFLNLELGKQPSLLVPVLTGLGISGSAAIGTSALIIGDINFKTLSKQIDQELHELEQSITTLESSLDSLADMVLQN
jgi:hypothetical protein